MWCRLEGKHIELKRRTAQKNGKKERDDERIMREVERERGIMRGT